MIEFGADERCWVEGDKKAFYEASQWTIKQNKETLELVKEENKHFREALALLQKVRDGFRFELYRELGMPCDVAMCGVQERGTISDKGAGNTVDKLTAEVNDLKKKYNELKHIARVRQKDLTQRNDELRDLERDGVRASADNPLTKQIRILDTKLEKVRTHPPSCTPARPSGRVQALRC